MQTTHKNLFTTIRTEGGILPADLLQRIAAGDGDVEGLTPESYHLAGSEKLNEAVNRSWNHLLGVWAAFRLGVAPAPESRTDPSTPRSEPFAAQHVSAGIIPAEGARGASSPPSSEALSGGHRIGNRGAATWQAGCRRHVEGTGETGRPGGVQGQGPAVGRL